jgi:hypothetical protein
MSTLTASSPTAMPGERIDYASTLTPRTKALVLAGVMMALFLAALDQTIVATALPRIVSELQGMEFFAWTSTSYLLASTTLVPIYGKLSDSLGRKTVILAGIAIFLVGSVLCGLADSMLALVVYRGIQGMGAAAITSTAFAVPADLFVPAERARYQGISRCSGAHSPTRWAGAGCSSSTCRSVPSRSRSSGARCRACTVAWPARWTGWAPCCSSPRCPSCSR